MSSQLDQHRLDHQHLDQHHLDQHHLDQHHLDQPHPSVPRISDEQILAGLRSYSALVGGRAFTIDEFAAWPDRPFAPETAAARFRTWRKALALAGIDRVHTRKHDAAELVSEFERLWRKIGRPPGMLVIHQRSRYGAGCYKRRWGSPRRLSDLIRLHHRGEITREQLLCGAPGFAGGGFVPPKLRWAVFKRDGHRCVVCGRSPSADNKLHLHADHIIPVSRGGTNDPSNLRTLCRDCNLGRGTDEPLQPAVTTPPAPAPGE